MYDQIVKEGVMCYKKSLCEDVVWIYSVH